MSEVERLSTQVYDFYTYQIDRITDDVECTVILRNIDRAPYGVCSVFKYKQVGQTINSPLVNWHNLFFCSNYYGPPPHPGYMNSAVQNGTKTASTAHVSPDEYKDLVRELPLNCHAMPYDGAPENMAIAYVYRDGTLDDLFGFEKVHQIYTLHGIHNVDWSRVEELFAKPLAYFSDSRCGFNIQSGTSVKENLIVMGLLLGYPIESTIAYIKNEYACFGDTCTAPEVRDHFRRSAEPYVDRLGKMWFKEGKFVFCDGQQESLYY